jgi:hypothetical protein
MLMMLAVLIVSAAIAILFEIVDIKIENVVSV